MSSRKKCKGVQIKEKSAGETAFERAKFFFGVGALFFYGNGDSCNDLHDVFAFFCPAVARRRKRLHKNEQVGGEGDFGAVGGDKRLRLKENIGADNDKMARLCGKGSKRMYDFLRHAVSKNGYGRR